MINESRFMNTKTYILGYPVAIVLSVYFCLFSIISSAQVTTEIDTTKIRIGEQISYKIKVEADSTALVVFPEGQSFSPLEMVEIFKIDTTKKETRFHLLREYKLTQFDSGSYTIPRQKIIIADKTFYTDSLRVDVNTVVVDTTKQKLYDIKPIIEVNKSSSKWWLYLLIISALVALAGFLLYWFIWRKKPLTEEEEIALLPPYDRAKLALQKLDNSQYLMRSELKEYYSELTLIIRKFLDEKVYDRALESTTQELIERLSLIKEGNQLPLENDTIKNIESVLKRADLVKFAKSAPDTVLAEMDKTTIGKELDAVKATLPEPSEEEKLLNLQYKEIQDRKKKRRKVILTVAISILLIAATFVGFGVKYGFGYVKDTIIGNESKTLLEGDWVKSAYGFPPVFIETPQVLKREAIEIPEQLKDKIKSTGFRYLSIAAGLDIEVNTINYSFPKEEQEQINSEEAIAKDVAGSSENFIKKMESEGAENIVVKREQFITPNAAEGLKTYGSMQLEINGTKYNTNYALLIFRAENLKQQIVLKWRSEDNYAADIIQRIIDSVELKSAEEEGENEAEEK